MTRWTNHQLRALREAIARGEKHAAIAARLGRTRMAVASMASRQGITRSTPTRTGAHPMLTAIALVLAAENCAPRGDVIGMLSESFGEVGHGGGLTRQTAVEIWANDESGTWTIITTRPDGMSCIVASGSDWGPIPAMEGAPA